jgi:hypothetical protein
MRRPYRTTRTTRQRLTSIGQPHGRVIHTSPSLSTAANAPRRYQLGDSNSLTTTPTSTTLQYTTHIGRVVCHTALSYGPHVSIEAVNRDNTVSTTTPTSTILQYKIHRQSHPQFHLVRPTPSPPDSNMPTIAIFAVNCFTAISNYEVALPALCPSPSKTKLKPNKTAAHRPPYQVLTILVCCHSRQGRP